MRGVNVPESECGVCLWCKCEVCVCVCVCVCGVSVCAVCVHGVLLQKYVGYVIVR